MRYPDSAAERADHHLLAALRRCGTDPHVAGAARALSWAGEHGAVWLAAGLAAACADPARRGVWLRATTLVGAAHAASMGVKRVVRRPRPVLPDAEPLVRTAGRHSFPSSHATSSAAAVVAFGTLLPRALAAASVPLASSGSAGPGSSGSAGSGSFAAGSFGSAPAGSGSLGLGSLASVPLAVAVAKAALPSLAAAMCVSRLVVGVHYPSDVACGALLGAFTARLGRSWALRGRWPS